MDSSGGNPGGRSLVGFQAPVVPVERQKPVVAEVRFDLMNPTHFSGVSLGQKLDNRRLPTPLVPHPEDQARITAEADGLLGASPAQGQRLFAEDMLSSRDRSFDL